MTTMQVKESRKDKEDEVTAYREAFEYFDWNKSGTIPNSVRKMDQSSPRQE
jgi:Ca2+-binding EF-hand superfamily protein